MATDPTSLDTLERKAGREESDFNYRAITGENPDPVPIVTLLETKTSTCRFEKRFAFSLCVGCPRQPVIPPHRHTCPSLSASFFSKNNILRSPISLPKHPPYLSLSLKILTTRPPLPDSNLKTLSLMLSVFNNASSEPPKKPKTPEILDRKSSLNSVLQPIHHAHPRLWLLLTILSIQIILLFTLRSVPYTLSLPHHRRRHREYINNSTSEGPEQDNCGSGRIFVYELPGTFNSEILADCDDLNPWSSRCNALANDGFGQNATGLVGTIPENLVPAWYWTDQFVSEIIFHNRVLKHKCRVLEPESATAFYIPFYAGLAVGKYLWTKSSAKERDHHCEMMLKWVQDQPFYKRSNGWDHFLTMGRITWDFRRSKDEDWGSSCIYMRGMRNISRLLIERNRWDYFDIGVPYPTGFHPRSDSDVTEWQRFVRERNRTSLFSFAGATRGTVRNDFRGLLLRQCNQTDACTVLDCARSRCSNGTSAILETFLSSKFCLQPRGDSFTRRSLFDCMIAGSIPVFFWRRTAYYQYEWFLPSEPESYSVFIDRNAVKNGTSVKEVLERYSEEDVRRMREKVIDYIPKMVYARPQEGLETIKDAFDVAIEGVLRRFKEQEEWGFKW